MGHSVVDVCSWVAVGVCMCVTMLDYCVGTVVYECSYAFAVVGLWASVGSCVYIVLEL